MDRAPESGAELRLRLDAAASRLGSRPAGQGDDLEPGPCDALELRRRLVESCFAQRDLYPDRPRVRGVINSFCQAVGGATTFSAGWWKGR